MRDAEAADGHAVVLHHVESKSAPPGAYIHNTLSWLEVQLAADVIHLGDLRFVQAHGSRREIRAGIHKQGVEPEPKEIVVQIVVPTDVWQQAEPLRP